MKNRIRNLYNIDPISIVKINDKCYIGITCQSKPERRWQNGLGYKTQFFYRAIEKYGWDGFNHIILHKGLSENQAKCLKLLEMH